MNIFGKFDERLNQEVCKQVEHFFERCLIDEGNNYEVTQTALSF
jgi:hypothetical protein